MSEFKNRYQNHSVVIYNATAFIFLLWNLLFLSYGEEDSRQLSALHLAREP